MKYKQKLCIGCGRPNVFSSKTCLMCYKEVQGNTKTWEECVAVITEWEKTFPDAEQNVGKGATEMLKHWYSIHENT